MAYIYHYSSYLLSISQIAASQKKIIYVYWKVLCYFIWLITVVNFYGTLEWVDLIVRFLSVYLCVQIENGFMIDKACKRTNNVFCLQIGLSV